MTAEAGTITDTAIGEGGQTAETSVLGNISLADYKLEGSDDRERLIYFRALVIGIAYVHARYEALTERQDYEQSVLMGVIEEKVDWQGDELALLGFPGARSKDAREKKEVRAQIGLFARALVARLSAIVPLEEVAETEWRAMNPQRRGDSRLNQGELHRRERVVLLRSPSYFGGSGMKQGEMAGVMGTSKSRIFQLEHGFWRKAEIVSKGKRSVSTLVGSRSLREVLEENLNVIFEEAAVAGGVVPTYILAPDATWKAASKLGQLAEGDEELRSRLESLLLKSPADYEFSWGVLAPLTYWMNMGDDRRFVSLAMSFLDQDLGESERGDRVIFSAPSVSGELRKIPSPDGTRLKAEDLDTRTLNTLKRELNLHGEVSIDDLCKPGLGGLLKITGMGIKGLGMIGDLLGKKRPEDKTTRDLSWFLGLSAKEQVKVRNGKIKLGDGFTVRDAD